MKRSFFSSSILLYIIIFLSFCIAGFKKNNPSYPMCSCFNERVLKYQKPLVKGSDVLELQSQLKRLGFYKGKLDGIYGKHTYTAVIKFQKSCGISVDGKVGFYTRLELARTFDEPVSKKSNGTPPPGKIAILIEIDKLRLTVLSNGKPYKQFPVAVGKFKTPTPIGNWKIIQKAKWGEGFGSRWMQMNVPWGVYGIHGTNKPWSIGNFASAGCVRMFNSHVEQLYSWVKIGTPVVITGGPYGPFMYGRKTLVKGDRGSDVLEVQKRLKGYGYYDGKMDGIFGWKMEKAVKDLQKDNGMKITGQVTGEVYNKLGIIRFE